jgi:hypothetical protein
MPKRGALVAMLLPLALLAACGDESGSAAADPTDPTPSVTESSTPSEPTESATEAELPDWPACADVWVSGAKLPLSYRGCIDMEAAVKADNLPCESGQRIVRFADRFYAVAGGKIYQTEVALEQDDGYLDMVTTCRA